MTKTCENLWVFHHRLTRLYFHYGTIPPRNLMGTAVKLEDSCSQIAPFGRHWGVCPPDAVFNVVALCDKKREMHQGEIRVDE